MIDLNSVQKPVRYIGNEWNAVTSKPEATLRMAFCFPDVYEVGMSYLGLQILYGLLNEHESIWCERAFAPWPDYEEALRREHEPLKTLESQTPLSEMDIIGFSVQHEMLYSNILTMLDLGNIPLEQKQREGSAPIIIAGGPCVYNPAPLVDFVDAFLLGEGEELLPAFCEAYRDLRDRGADRDAILHELAKIPGVFVPSLYRWETNRLGETLPGEPLHADLPAVVERQLVDDFENAYSPKKPIVPNTQVVHHRLALEVMRGCPGGCRFCHAGFVTRPKRERSPKRLMEDAEASLKETGYGELGLLSLSTADYTALPNLCYNLVHEYYDERISLSLPSLRIDKFPARVTEELGKVGGTGLTFAPEAGTERLRNAINKPITDQAILDQVAAAITQNQGTVKFYFMIGLPTETDADLQGIVDLMKEVKNLLRSHGWKRTQIHVGLSPFVPKPHTPYQWYAQISIDEMYRRIHYINDQLKPLRIKVNWHDPKKSVLESAFARGDARLGQVLLTAWKLGARFDEWQEGFDYSIWEEAFTRHGFTLPEYAAKSYEGADIFPWQAISILVESRYLWKEWEKTFQEKTTVHCGYEQCRACRVCDGERTHTVNIDKNGNHFALYREQDNAEIAPKANQKSPTGQPFRYRIRFQKLGPLKYASHRDFMGIFESTLRRGGIKMAYSEGFNPRPRIVYASALSTGMESYGEYLDIATKHDYPQEEVKDILVNNTQDGFVIVHVEKLPPNAKKISSLVKAFAFEVLFRHAGDLEEAGNVIRDVISQPNIQSELNLIHYWLESVTKGYVKMGYLCALNHGKFTKAREISEKIREKSHIMLDIDKVLRLDMLKLNQQNEYVPIIPIHSALEKRELCNAKS